MKPIFLFALTGIAISIGCNTPDSQNNFAEEKKDTIYIRDTVPQSNALLFQNLKKNNPSFDGPISWDDFKSDSIEFRKIREVTPVIKDAKSILIRFEINMLVSYLKYLQDQKIDSVNVFFGKYVNKERQTSGTPIPETHRKKLTVMFAGQNTSKEATPFTPPYNVGNPWP